VAEDGEVEVFVLATDAAQEEVDGPTARDEPWPVEAGHEGCYSKGFGIRFGIGHFIFPS